MVSTLVSACARLLAGPGRMITLWVRRPLSVSQHGANSAVHPSGVGKSVVIHVIRYMDYGVKA